MLKSPSHHAALAGLLLLTVSAAAQAAPLMTAPPASPKTAPAVDPQVTALFKQTVAAYKALPALTATVAVSGSASSENRTITLAFQKPNHVKFIVSDKSGPISQLCSDGNTLAIYSVKKQTYQVEPIPSNASVVSVVLTQTNAILPGLIGSPELLNDILVQPGVTARIISVRSDPSPTVDTILVTLPTHGGEAAFTVVLDKSDHLLRQVTENTQFTVQNKKIQMSQTDSVTMLSTTPTLTAADFVFTPPAGVRKITAPKAAQSPLMHDPRLIVCAKPFAVTAKDLSGKPLTLAQYKGKVVLMDFWATWCGPCVGEMPNVQAAYKKYHTQGFDIVGVSLDQSLPALTGFIAENKLPWRQVFDGKGWDSAVPREYGVQSIPFGLLIGRDGKIAAVDVRGPSLATAIQQALAK